MDFFGFGLLSYKITQLVMNKIEQPTLPSSGDARYLTLLSVSGKEEPQVEIKEKIRAALKLLTFLEQHVLVQFWSPRDVGKHQILTTLDQPFGLGVANDELCFYRRSSEQNEFSVDNEEYTGPPARVYRKRLPEWTFDITNYESKDFPQKDLAIRCNLHGYMALPVFDIATTSCLGVLELLVSSIHMPYVHVVEQVHSALKKQSLACPRAFVRPASYVPNEYDKIHGILKSVCHDHKLPLAQTWAVSPSTSFVSHDKIIKKSCSSFGTKCIGKVCCMSTVALPYYVKEDSGMWKFMEECRKRHMYKSEGVVGRASSLPGVFFCRDVTKLNEVEYPLVCGNKVKSCFAISLHPVEGDDEYVLEFFLPVGTNDRRFVKDVVKTLKIKTASDFVLGDKSSMDLSDSSDSESSVTDVSKSTCSANDPETESSTNVSMENRHAAIYTDDGETSSPFIQGAKKRRR